MYDGWAAGGAPGWGSADLLPYFRRSEHAEGRDQALRGTEGVAWVDLAIAGRPRVSPGAGRPAARRPAAGPLG